MLALVLAPAACGPPASNVDVHAAPAPGTASATAAPTAAPQPQPHAKFEPDAPLVPLPSAEAVAAAKCRVADFDLGAAKEVVSEGYLYPVHTAFGPTSGLIVWAREGKLGMRVVGKNGAPSSAVLDGPGWTHAPTVVALRDGFVLLHFNHESLELLKLDASGNAAGAPASVTLPAALGTIVDILRTSDTEITILAEPPREDFSPDKGTLMVSVTLQGAGARAELRRLAVSHLPADVVCVPGQYGGASAILLARISHELSLVHGGEVTPVAEPDIVFDTHPTVELYPVGGSNPTGFPYGPVTLPRTPRMPYEGDLDAKSINVVLSDPDWRGLANPVWTGTHFLLGRLSGDAPATHARLFAIDCRK